MSLHQRTALSRYGVVFVSVGIATALNLTIPQLRDHEAFVLFFAAVTVSAWYGGRGPGILASLLAAFITDYVIWPPAFVILLDMESLVPVVVFVFVALTVSHATNELARAEESTREQQQWLQVILSSIADAVVATDAKGKVRFINSAAQTMTGLSESNAVGRDVDDVLKIYSRQSGESVVIPVRELSGNSSHQNLYLTGTTGKVVSIETTVSPIKSTPGGLVMVIRDLTEREEANSRILEYQQRLRSLASELSLAEERERREIANCLHDRIGQTLALANIKLRTFRGGLHSAEMISAVDEISQLLKAMISEMRSLTFELSPPILYEFGLEPALEWLSNHFQKNHGLECEFIGDGNASNLRPDIRVFLFQSVRELLTNVIKHARARHASVKVTETDNEIIIEVRDDGVGSRSEEMFTSTGMKGFGLFSLRERIAHLGGKVEIISRPGEGTIVTLQLPVNVSTGAGIK